jgi:hypothetical protein
MACAELPPQGQPCLTVGEIAAVFGSLPWILPSLPTVVELADQEA